MILFVSAFFLGRGYRNSSLASIIMSHGIFGQIACTKWEVVLFAAMLCSSVSCYFVFVCHQACCGSPLSASSPLVFCYALALRFGTMSGVASTSSVQCSDCTGQPAKLNFCPEVFDQTWCGRAQGWHKTFSGKKNWHCPQCCVGVYTTEMKLLTGFEKDWEHVSEECKVKDTDGKYTHTEIAVEQVASSASVHPSTVPLPAPNNSGSASASVLQAASSSSSWQAAPSTSFQPATVPYSSAQAAPWATPVAPHSIQNIQNAIGAMGEQVQSIIDMQLVLQLEVDGMQRSIDGLQDTVTGVQQTITQVLQAIGDAQRPITLAQADSNA